MEKFYCYILKNNDIKDLNKTYNGFTNKPERRIRQHNQEIKGGARYTKKFGNKSWEMYVLITGFPDNVNALQCEWKIKHPNNKTYYKTKKYNSVAGRIVGLSEVLKQDKWTNQSTKLNADSQFTVWIIKEFAHLLTDLPNNITVIPVDSIAATIVDINVDVETDANVETSATSVSTKKKKVNSLVVVTDIDTEVLSQPE